ncbi:50S ribosomal protein L23 [Candidatus Parcubacteria bacterium]|nr:50S ribosomal protein L23 [Candidatus Parcubacteria bacterium]
MKDLYAGEAGKVKTVSSGKKETRGKTARTGRAYKVLLRPLITEKAGNSGVLNKYFFAVADNANKIEINKAVSDVYGIKPIAVNVVSMQGKKTRNGKIRGKRKDWKKAIVTLPKGKSINIYEGV